MPCWRCAGLSVFRAHGANIRELLNFQERQERLASATSILNSIILSPYRELILKQLKGEAIELKGNYVAVKTVKNWAHNMAVVCMLVAIVIGIAGFALHDKNATAAGFLIFIGVALLAVFVYFIAKSAELMNAASAEERKREANAIEEQRIQAILVDLDRLAHNFRATAIPLLKELVIALNLDELEEVLFKLRAYEKWGCDLVGFYTKT